jgi:hypothetical protein
MTDKLVNTSQASRSVEEPFPGLADHESQDPHCNLAWLSKRLGGRVFASPRLALGYAQRQSPSWDNCPFGALATAEQTLRSEVGEDRRSQLAEGLGFLKKDVWDRVHDEGIPPCFPVRFGPSKEPNTQVKSLRV